MRSFLVLFFLIISSANAYVDLSLSYTFSRNVIEGTQNITTPDVDPGKAISSTEGHNAIWAWYLWEYTALEFNYAQSTNKVVDNRVITTDDDTITISKVNSTVNTIVQGIGLRQSFASRSATLIPSLSLGFAEFISSGRTTYEIDNNGTPDKLTIEKDTQKQKSSYVTFMLRIRLTELIGLSLAAKAVMPDFETEKAQNNVTYSAGLSWVF